MFNKTFYGSSLNIQGVLEMINQHGEQPPSTAWNEDALILMICNHFMWV